MFEEIISVEGNKTLSGDVYVHGAKNSALKLMAASILAQDECVIRNVPVISDIAIMKGILESLGATLERNGHIDRDFHTVTVDTSGIDHWDVPYDLVSKMRASISVLGPLLARFGHAQVPMPGGCQIGARGIDMHLRGLEALGASFKLVEGDLCAETPNGLVGAEVNLEFPSVGATENVVMAAVRAKGTTVINNAAQEPEIEDLCEMLCEMGAKIEGSGSSRIVIEGVEPEQLHGCDHATIGDRIEAGTFLVGAALTGGPVTVHGVAPEHLGIVLVKLEEMGCDVSCTPDSITVSRTRPLVATQIQTLPYPGFPTDMQAQFMVLSLFADDVSFITENIFENRFMFAAELARLGADITLEGHHAIVKGGNPLEGAPIKATDLRAGGAAILAAIMADGITEVHDIHHIDRGYEDYVGKLSALGAHLTRKTIEVPEYEEEIPDGTSQQS